jgi:hypothetical protein
MREGYEPGGEAPRVREGKETDELSSKAAEVAVVLTGVVPPLCAGMWPLGEWG